MSSNVVLEHIDNPARLEKAFRESPETFRKDLDAAILINRESETIRVWHARLSYQAGSSSAPRVSVIALVFLCLAAGLLVKLPSIFSINESWYYPRFVPIVVLSAVVLYFLFASGNKNTARFVIGALASCVVYLLILPDGSGSASITMALIHVPLVVFSLLAVSIMSDRWGDVEARMQFVRCIGEVAIYTALVLLGGVVLTMLTLGLFDLIGLSIATWYVEHVVVLGLVSAPTVAAYLYDSVQNRQSTFAPVLANVFTPLFLVTVCSYLVVSVLQGKSPFNDRDFLVIFNGLLIFILALTVFSISGKKGDSRVGASDYVNICLVVATLVVNVVALSAIVFRWAEYGITLNRIVVAGANIIIFVNLIIILFRYLAFLRGACKVTDLESAIARYFPVYTGWSIAVAVVLPLFFQFR